MRRKTPPLPVIVLLALWLATSLAATSCTVRMPPPGYKSEPRALSEPTRPAEGMATETISTPEPIRQSPVQPSSDPRLPPRASAGPVFGVVEVAAKVRPAVAQILVKGTVPSLFEPIPTSGVGSGVVFDRRGYIITNNHVIEEADEIVVTLPERERTYNARLVGRDPSTDLAVIQIEDDNLPVAELGDSDAVQVGEQVVAIGNALGLEGGPTVTSGVVSALNRSIDEPTGATLHQLIQTDAAINPGNSGGPLVNMAAQVIGINTAVATGSSRVPAQGIGFAISINSAKPIVEDLLAYGKVRRPYLGVELATVTPAIARQNRLAVDRGAYIVRVVRGGPAARAGLQPGDIIVKIESDTIQSIADLRKVLARARIGQQVKVEVARGSDRRTFDVTLGEMPAP